MFEAFARPLDWDKAFPAEQGQPQPVTDADTAAQDESIADSSMTGEGLEGDRGVLASFLDGKSKPAQALAVLLHGMYEEEYDDVAQLAVSNEPHQLLLDAKKMVHIPLM